MMNKHVKFSGGRVSIWICLLFLLVQFQVFAQQKISGKVTSQGGNLQGVVVKVKGAQAAAQTDNEGNFTIEASAGATLTFSYVGYQTRELALSPSQSTVRIELNADEAVIDEVVVVGYGTQKAKDLTGAIATLKSENFKDQPILQAASALQGRVAGVSVSQNSGAPGGEAKIRIRGSNSISGSNDPLYIVDGVAMISFSLQALNPNDIETMDVLKDASATAVYGSRGANGVVIITTKKGKSGATKVAYDGFVNFNAAPKRYDLLSPAEYANMANLFAGKTVFPDANNYQGPSTDWQSELFKKSSTQNHQVSLSGGGEKARFFVSGFLMDQNGTLVNTGQKRFGLRSNTDITVNDRVTVGINLFGQRTENHNNAQLFAKGNPIMASVVWAPTESIWEDEANGLYNRTGISPIWVNPYLTAMETNEDNFGNAANLNGNVKYRITDWLTFTSNVGLDMNLSKAASLGNDWVSPGNMRSSQSYSETYAFQNSNILTFNKRFNDAHELTVTAVEESTVSTSNNFLAAGSGLTSLSNGYYNLALNTSQSINSGYSKWSLLSFMGRANYSYKGKYLATVSFRRDGSSKFQPNNRWSNFPSFSLGWNLTEEQFIRDLNVFSSLKLRGGWGKTGNQAIGPYQTLGLMSPLNYAYGTTGSYLGYSIGNPAATDLRWETTEQTDIGLDVGLFNNRLNITADYYNKNTVDLLLPTQILRYLGGGELLSNVGDINNRGFDLGISATPIDKENFRWETSLNAGFNKNKVVSLRDGEDMFKLPRLGGGLINADFQVVKKGESLGAFYLIPWEGVHQVDDPSTGRKAGDYKYKDVDGNGSIGYEDMVIAGNATPTLQWGFNNHLTYKNFDLNIFIQGAGGHQIFNATYAAASIVSSDVLYPTLAEVSNYWTPENPSNEWASPGSTAKAFVESTQFLQDADFARLKNLSLTYKLPQTFMKFAAASVSLSAQNLFTITKYKGLDPEASTTSASSDTNVGIDLGAYPSPKTYSVRLNLTF